MFYFKVAPNIWQRLMNQMLAGIPGTTCFFDDMLVQGGSKEESLDNLSIVFLRLRNRNNNIYRSHDPSKWATSSGR